MIRPLPLLLLLLIAGCASDSTVYPSLARRPVEARGFAEPEVSTPIATPDASLDARLAAIAGRIDAAARGFDGDASTAEGKVKAARGASVGSAAWLDAQQALGELDGWRAQASGIVSDIDDIGTERAAALATPYPALAPLRERAQAEADREAAMIQQLQASLPAA